MLVTRPALLFALLVIVSLWLASASGSAAGSTTIYVSATSGNDVWSGRLAAPNSGHTDGPLATFDRARQVVESIDKSQLAIVNVVFRQGVYRLSDAVVFGPADSGSTQTEIVYESYPGEHPVISGGIALTGWQNTGGNTWVAQVPAGSKEFENLFYDGDRRLRPRLGGYLGAYERVFQTYYAPSFSPTCPKNGSATGPYECFDRFLYNPDPSSPDYLDPAGWGNYVPEPNNPCGQPVVDATLSRQIEILDFEQFSTSKLRLSCVDTANHLVYTTGPTGVPGANNASEAGFITGNRYVVENVKNALTQQGQWYLNEATSPWTVTYISNNGENPNSVEITAPQAKQLVIAHDVQYLTFRGLTFAYDNYVIPREGHASSELESEISSAVSFENSQHITIDGVTVEHTAGGGLDFINCLQQYDSAGHTVSPSWCKVFEPSGIISDELVENSTFFDIGANGIRVGMNNNQVLDSLLNDGNAPHRVTVRNSVVEGYGRVFPAAFGIGQGFGHDNLYTHNEVYDGYHCAISISWGGGDTTRPNGKGIADNTISFNSVHDLMQGIMNDGGSIRVDDGNAVFTGLGNKVLNNRIHDTNDASVLDGKSGYGGNGVYLDNNTGAVDVENNLIYRVSDFAVYTPQGPALPLRPNIVHNNILAFARAGMIAVNAPYKGQAGPNFAAHQVFTVTNNIMLFDRSEASVPHFAVQAGCTYSANLPFILFESFAHNVYWRTDHTFSTDMNAFHIQPQPATGTQDAPCSRDESGFTFYSFQDWQAKQFEDIGSLILPPGFIAPAYPQDDFSFFLGIAPGGFIPFNYNQDGRSCTTTCSSPPAVKRTFRTATYDPSSDF